MQKTFQFFSQGTKSVSLFSKKSETIFKFFFGQYVKTIRYFLLFYNFSSVFSNMCAKIIKFLKMCASSER